MIATCRPEHPDFKRQLEALAHPQLLGFRRVLHTQPDELSTSSLFRMNIARVGKAGLTFNLCMLPRQLEHGAALIDACPDSPAVRAMSLMVIRLQWVIWGCAGRWMA